MKINNFFKVIYEKLLKINDTPQKISLGLGLGVALGIIPGTGPIAALTLAFILRLNRMAALMGSLMVNTWISIVTLVLAVKLGAKVFSLKWQDVYNDWILLIKDFQWQVLLKSSVYKIILPIFTGYVIMALACGILVYGATLLALIYSKYGRKD